MFSNDEEAEISQRDSKESVEEGSSSHSKSKEEGKTTQEAASKQQNGSSSDVESLQQNELIEKQSHFFFGQIFTDEDVITLLQGQIDFKSEHGDESKTEFHLFVKDKLHMEFTKLQVTEKLRRLKTKQIVLSEEKEQNVEKEILEDEVDVESNYPLLPQSFQMNIGGIISSDMLKTIWAMMGSDKARHFEAEWRNLMIQELELHLKETELVLKVLKGFHLFCH
ncbi:probable transcription factor At1g44810 [Olea europaea var. sylvestris]|uniref:probable transcription factor At1g44810 n=1 Tax=Olea europaea var. sylvestris TaxID=158386 RepID=UPI000C1CD917|nr:probable transcription factor At1g44810 [Olea europaea var. sylvestris]